MQKPFEIISRAVIINDGKILLCKSKVRENYFFPGGHVEFGESAEEALKREIKEELGEEAIIKNFIGTVQNVFTAKMPEDKEETLHHELNLIFEATLDNSEIESKESHLEFRWFNLEEIKKENILPEKLKSSVISWIKQKNTFWA